MSYSSVVPINIHMGDGTQLVVADVPVEDLSKTFFEVARQQATAALPGLVSQILEQADAYAMTSLWPTVRGEVDRATSQAEARTMTLAKSAGKQALAIGALVAMGVGAVGWYFYRKR